MGLSTVVEVLGSGEALTQVVDADGRLVSGTRHGREVVAVHPAGSAEAAAALESHAAFAADEKRRRYSPYIGTMSGHEGETGHMGGTGGGNGKTARKKGRTGGVR